MYRDSRTRYCMVSAVGCSTLMVTGRHRQRQEIPNRTSWIARKAPLRNSNTSMEAQSTENTSALGGVAGLGCSHGNKASRWEVDERGSELCPVAALALPVVTFHVPIPRSNLFYLWLVNLTTVGISDNNVQR
jgi:hypothetical protein